MTRTPLSRSELHTLWAMLVMPLVFMLGAWMGKQNPGTIRCYENGALELFDETPNSKVYRLHCERGDVLLFW